MFWRVALAISILGVTSCNNDVQTKFAITCSGDGSNGAVEHTFIIDGVEGVSYGYKDGRLYGPRGGHKVKIANGKVSDDEGLVIDLVAGIGEKAWTRPGLSDFAPFSYTYSRCLEGSAPLIEGHSGVSELVPQDPNGSRG